MVRFLLSLRFLMLAASFGALIGALLMGGIAAVKLAQGAGLLVSGSPEPREITAAVMGAVDAMLFGVVLIIFAFAITFGFVFDAPKGERVPAWMRPQGVGELKRTLVEVILVYLVVDFAIDVSLQDAHAAWTNLVVPVAVLLIAAALRLLPEPEKHPPRETDPPAHGKP